MEEVQGFIMRNIVYIETYGCQMNLADTEILSRILLNSGYEFTDKPMSANVILINTCSVRQHAEQRVFGRLNEFQTLRKENPSLVIGILGCMAERLRDKLIELMETVDLVVGPDEYRALPSYIDSARKGEKVVATRLSREETYDDVKPLRCGKLSAWIPVMRGCNNFCSYCVVPYTRGRERSRPLLSILKEVEELSDCGYKEINLLGQNVNSYKDGKLDFADLLERVADVDSRMRIRFITSHPQDIFDKLIYTIASKKNICKHFHLPVQSGSDRILKLMNRNYTSSYYKSLVRKIRDIIPGVSLTTDIIAGFPTETEDDHRATIDLIEEIRFDSAFTFLYSPRENTKASSMDDDVLRSTKVRRLNEIIEVQRRISLELNKELIGRSVEVLVEGPSKKSNSNSCGRTETNKMVVFQKNGEAVGDYVNILIKQANAATLIGERVT